MTNIEDEMKHKECQKLIDKMFHTNLSQNEVDVLDAHLEGCEECLKYFGIINNNHAEWNEDNPLMKKYLENLN